MQCRVHPEEKDLQPLRVSGWMKEQRLSHVGSGKVSALEQRYDFYIHINIHITTRKASSMRNLITLILALFALAGTTTGQIKQKSVPQKADAPKSESVVIKVPTVVCSSCVITITKALKTVEGVKSTKIDIKKKTATVTYASTKVSLSQIEKAIANAGYDANSTKRDPAAYEKLDACCKKDAKE